MGRKFASRACLILLIIGAQLVAARTALAVVTTRCSEEFRLDGSGNETPWSDPDYQLPDVSVQICITVDSKTGKVTQKLEFKNFGANAVEFLFCNMIELNAGKALMINNCDLSCLDAGGGNKKWGCDRSMLGTEGRLSEEAPGWHFGCDKITIPARANPTTPSSVKPTPKMSAANVDQFKGKFAWDFEVSYADIFSLAQKPYNAADCSLMTCDFEAKACTKTADCDADRGYCEMSDPHSENTPPGTDPDYANVFETCSKSANGGAGDCANGSNCVGSNQCTGCFGENKAINMGDPTIGRASATGYWSMGGLPIKDPFVWSQDLNTLQISTKEYDGLKGKPPVTSGFPVDCPELGRALPGAVPPSSYDQELLLWDIHTMSADPSTVTPVNIVPVVAPNPYGVAVQVPLSSLDIGGGSMGRSTLTIVADDPLTPAPEGTKLDFFISITDQEPSPTELWVQSGTLIQDTEPPFVQSAQDFNVSIDGCTVQSSITATDDTTFPVAANFFYSVDGGLNWEVRTLTPDLDILDGSNVNTFQSSFQLPLFEHQEVEYFFHVQDQVFNHLWFGPDTQMSPVTCDALAISLSTFTAEFRDGAVVLRWQTESEIDNEGYRIRRSMDPNGESRVVSPFLPAEGGPSTGAEYEFIDDSVEPGVTYYYLLEDLDTSGLSALHGQDACEFDVGPDCQPLSVLVPGISAAEFCESHEIRSTSKKLSEGKPNGKPKKRNRYSGERACNQADWRDNEDRHAHDCVVAKGGDGPRTCVARPDAN